MNDTTGTIDSTTGEATATESSASTESGKVAPEGSQGPVDNAGGEQSTSEGGKANGTDSRKSFRSKNQTIYELRQAVRDRDVKLQSFEERLASFEQKFQPRQERKPSRTFWEAPEEVLDERITGHLSEMEKRLLDRMEQRDAQNQMSSDWKQEASEAAKLITSQKDLTDDDMSEIKEIVDSNPAMQKMRPMERAEYALYLWQKEKGITDKSGMKQRATSVQGTPPTASGKRMWTKSEMDREVAKFPTNPGMWTPEQSKAWTALDNEFQLASSEGRIRK